MIIFVENNIYIFLMSHDNNNNNNGVDGIGIESKYMANRTLYFC